MPAQEADARKAAKTVVFADNDALLVEALGELLRDKGYEVHVARDGLEALLTIRKVKPDCVILDIVMPKVDGSRVCWLVRQDPALRGTPIIALSGLSPQDIRRFPELSADAYVAKGPLAIIAGNILAALKYLDEKGRGDFAGGIFGYEGFRPRKIISEMLLLKRHWETLVRTFGYGVLELDTAGRILLANGAATELLGDKEARLIGKAFSSLCQAQDRNAVQEILDRLAKTRLPEVHHAVVSLGNHKVSLRFASTVEDGECTGILCTMETNSSAAEVQKGRPSRQEGRATSSDKLRKHP
jgi:PAS domain S-box-containing protein